MTSNSTRLRELQQVQQRHFSKVMEHDQEMTVIDRQLATVEEKIKQLKKMRSERDLLVLTTIGDLKLTIHSIDTDTEHVLDSQHANFEGPPLTDEQIAEFESKFDNLVKEQRDTVGSLESNHKREEDKISGAVSKAQAKTDLLTQSIAGKEKQVRKISDQLDSTGRAKKAAGQVEPYHIAEKESLLKAAEQKVKDQEPKLMKKLKALQQEKIDLEEKRHSLQFRVQSARDNVKAAQTFSSDATRIDTHTSDIQKSKADLESSLSSLVANFGELIEGDSLEYDNLPQNMTQLGRALKVGKIDLKEASEEVQRRNQTHATKKAQYEQASATFKNYELEEKKYQESLNKTIIPKVTQSFPKNRRQELANNPVPDNGLTVAIEALTRRIQKKNDEEELVSQLPATLKKMAKITRRDGRCYLCQQVCDAAALATVDETVVKKIKSSEDNELAQDKIDLRFHGCCGRGVVVKGGEVHG
jgi:hypothetical protein